MLAVFALAPGVPARWVLVTLAVVHLLLTVAEFGLRRLAPAFNFGLAQATITAVLMLLAIHLSGGADSPLVIGLAWVLTLAVLANLTRLQVTLIWAFCAFGLLASTAVSYGSAALFSTALWLELGIYMALGIYAGDLVDTIRLRTGAAWLDARVDALTGVSNRRAFEEAYQFHLQQWRQRSVPFTVIMADVDNMKATNDHFGHAAGDRLLQEAATLLQGAVRATDRVFRYGGDEFAVILSGAGELVAPVVIERLRLAGAGRADAVPISIGWSSSTQLPAEQVLRAADAAMYQDKQNRRRQARGQIS